MKFPENFEESAKQWKELMETVGLEKIEEVLSKSPIKEKQMTYQILNTKTNKVKKFHSTQKVYRQLLKDGFDEGTAWKIRMWCLQQFESNNYIHWISKEKLEVLMVSAIAKIK